jgi:hypothetical protein
VCPSIDGGGAIAEIFVFDGERIKALTMGEMQRSFAALRMTGRSEFRSQNAEVKPLRHGDVEDRGEMQRSFAALRMTRELIERKS